MISRPRDIAVMQGAAAYRPATRARSGYRHAGKRAKDIALTLAILPLVLPVLLVLALLVRRDGGPAFFAHVRVGRDGRLFRCYKLRSMVPDAAGVLARHLAADAGARAEWVTTHKLRHDPRVTPLGRFLRRSSLDELPQVWNVLAGVMSLVGPRPVTEAELARYGDRCGSYLAVRPGVTGLWQVSGRNQTSYARRVALDTDYVARMSLPVDMAILWRTLGEVLRRTGC